jgi:type VI secretion system secreted protein VgrG
VQYRETDFDFISRLLEEDGIFYFFEHGKDRHLLVFGDGPVNYQPIAGRATLQPGTPPKASAHATRARSRCGLLCGAHSKLPPRPSSRADNLL